LGEVTGLFNAISDLGFITVFAGIFLAILFLERKQDRETNAKRQANVDKITEEMIKQAAQNQLIIQQNTSVLERDTAMMERSTVIMERSTAMMERYAESNEALVTQIKNICEKVGSS